MTRLSTALLSTLLLALGATAQAANWEAGKQYTVLTQAQRTNVAPGKVEVMEVFSYGCPACNTFRPVMRKLRTSLPTNAQLVYLPASWHAEENWPLLQRAFFTAQSLGVAEKAHEAVYDAIWTTGELAVTEPGSNRLKSKLPSIEDIAKLYQRVAGVKPADFVAASNSFGVNLKMRQADNQITAMQVPSTPTLVVNGKYRLNNETLKGADEIIELVKFLVAKESTPVAARAAKSAPAKKP
jgi:protein dithiol oxidoreductase (disulfide-forming)